MSTGSSFREAYDKRDIANFLDLRAARPEDDLAIGQLLISTFEGTYEEKLPHLVANGERRAELIDVARRRRSGQVMVLELGYRIVGTFAMIKPGVRVSQAWLPNAANLRCVAVDPEFHGYGFSALLLDEVIKIARKWEVSHVCLHVHEGAGGVARLYMERGFQRAPEGDLISCGLRIEAYFLSMRGT